MVWRAHKYANIPETGCLWGWIGSNTESVGISNFYPYGHISCPQGFTQTGEVTSPSLTAAMFKQNVHHPNCSQCKVTLLVPALTTRDTASLASNVKPSGPHTAIIVKSLFSVLPTISLILAVIEGRPRIIGTLELDDDSEWLFTPGRVLGSPFSIPISNSGFGLVGEGNSSAGAWATLSSESLWSVEREEVEGLDPVTWIVDRTSGEDLISVSSLENQNCCSVGTN